MDNKLDPKVAWWRSGMEMFLKMSGWIGGPVIAGTFIGKYLDKKFDTTPWLFLLSVGISFIVSMIALVHIGLKEMKKIEKENKK
ncbi:MAG: hypothetical protein ACD_11C00030G0025 [uncultured bacterium]|nr:MAG: hypothetical protein ACD_11C00030G0025 [uncultured bacterium]HBR71638.1 hypothetical protein [Candidatus Moranbacteria bacterium]